MPVQAVCPLGQLVTHAPAEHVCPGAHALPHAPQLDGSRDVFAQKRTPISSAHAVSVAAHSVVHAPIEHTCPAGHARPHMPQWARSVSVSTQSSIAAPSTPALDMHTTCGGAQATRQAPARHAIPRPHALPHAPQWVALARVSTHAPPQTVSPSRH
jgi:hypothetical protein